MASGAPDALYESKIKLFGKKKNELIRIMFEDNYFIIFKNKLRFYLSLIGYFQSK